MPDPADQEPSLRQMVVDQMGRNSDNARRLLAARKKGPAALLAEVKRQRQEKGIDPPEPAPDEPPAK